MSLILKSQEPQNPSVKDSGELASSYKVSFYPSTDDYAYIAQKVSSAQEFPKLGQYGLQAFLAVNMFALPLVLWYFDQFLVGLIVFALELLFSIAILPSLMTSDFKQHYRTIYSGVEKDLLEVELTDEGLWCRHPATKVFVEWSEVKRIEETKSSIYFFFDHNGMVVAKSGFAYDDEKNRFLSFAKRHVKAFVTG